MQPKDFTRLANNFYLSKGIESSIERISVDAEMVNYFHTHQKDLDKKYKVAMVCICLNEPYWPFAKDMIEGAKQFFLPGHQTDFFLWTDMLESDTSKLEKTLLELGKEKSTKKARELLQKEIEESKKVFGATIIKTEPMSWPLPTLFRYNLFLEQEEKLKEYDYIFYCDVDMKFVNVVGDEILGSGITAAVHPMYHLDKKFWPPYEPNENSASFIKRPGKIINENGKPRFMPFYYAGGFQGGKSKIFIEAMKETNEIIKKDYNNGYVPIWNDESAWNKYLSDNEPEIVLSPSYIYPDSLVEEYYIKIWGCNYPPKLVTLTKKFTTSKEGGDAVNKLINQLK